MSSESHAELNGGPVAPPARRAELTRALRRLAEARPDGIRHALRRLCQYGLPPRSLAARMAGAFALALALIVLGASSWVYWGLSARMMQEDRESVLRKLDTVAAVLRRHPVQSSETRQEVDLALPADAPHNLFVRLRGADGQMLLQTPGFDPALLDTDFDRPGVDGRPRLRKLHLRHGHHYLTAMLPVVARLSPGLAPQRMRLEVALNRTTESRILADYRIRLLFVLLAATVTAAATGYGIAWRGLHPLRHMADAARDIGANELHRRLDARDLPVELQTLAVAFNATLQRLEEAFGRISRFSADIAHELRTPISNLWGGLEVALGRPREAGQYREALESAVEECARLSRMIQTLLLVAQTERPDAVLKRERLDVHRELLALAEFYEATAAEAGVRLRVDGPLGLIVAADRVLLQRALANLISNAIAHTPPGGEVRLTARRHAGMVRTSVSDTGCGIAPEHLPFLFDRFYRADPARSRHRGGLGLGLSLVRNIVRLHGGEAQVWSIEGKGTRVDLDWPVCADLTTGAAA